MITILGQVPAAKNRHIISMRGSRPMLLPNKEYRAWKEDAAWQLKQAPPITNYPISLTCLFYVKDNRGRDMDNMLASVLDALQKAGVIENDDWQHIRPITIDCAGIDKANPRVEVYLDD